MAALLVACAGALAPAESRGQCRYSLDLIEGPFCPPLTYSSTHGYGLDGSTIVGGFEPCVVAPSRPFIWTPETGFVEYPLAPGSNWTRFGHVAGRWVTAQMSAPGGSAGVYDRQLGRYDTIQRIPFGVCFAEDVNRAGVVVGTRSIGGGPDWPRSAYRRDPDGTITDLGLLGYEITSASAINDAGMVVGTLGDSLEIDARAFIWRGDDVEALSAAPGALSSAAIDVNRFGDVLIYGKVADPSDGVPRNRPFIWRAGTWETLEPIGEREAINNPASINDRRQVVGSLRRLEDPDRLAVLWQNGQPCDLNRHLATLDPVVRVVLHRAYAINNDGWILCEAFVFGHFGGTKAALLRPIEPPRGDVTGDCAVDFDDLRAVLAQWSLKHAPADADADGVVGPGDLVLVLEGMAG